MTLPVWGGAVLWAMVAGSGLLVGTAAAYFTKPEHSTIARVMAFGAGTLLGTVSIQLVLAAQAKAGAWRTMTVLLSGALVFSIVNAFLARAGAQHRKRCGRCLSQDNERDTPGSGRAIALGTMIDALPEGLVLGIAVAQSAAPSVPLVAGFFLANVPESLSSSAGMRHAGRSKRYILSVWTAAIVVNLVAAGCGALFFAASSSSIAGTLEAFSGGILLAMAVETMIPEAFDKAPLFSGTVAALGFAAVAAVAALASLPR